MRFLLIACLLLSGCALFKPKGTINVGKASVTAVADAGKPATLATSDAKESVAIPKDTTVTITEHAATPTTPAYKVTELHFNSPTEWQKFAVTTAANTGTVDTSVAKAKVGAQESRPLLYAAILSGLGAILFVYLSYPTPAMLCGASAGLFFLAWKVSDLPPWFWALGLVGLAAGAALYFGHRKGLYEPVPTTPPKL